MRTSCRRGSAVLPSLAVAALAAAANGCVYATTTLWPRQTVVEVVELPAEVDIDGTPSGATVRRVGEAGAAAPAPYRYRTTYRVRRTHQRYSKWGPIVGSIIALPLAVYANARYFSDPDAEGLPGLLFALGTSIEVTWGLLAPVVVLPDLDRAARQRQRSQVIARQVDFEVGWTGWDPVRVSAEVPAQTRVSATRPSSVTFEQALVHWHQTSGRQPVGEGLYELGQAYRRRYRLTGDPADAAQAVSALRAYLAGEVASERRVEVEAQISVLEPTPAGAQAP